MFLVRVKFRSSGCQQLLCQGLHCKGTGGSRCVLAIWLLTDTAWSSPVLSSRSGSISRAAQVRTRLFSKKQNLLKRNKSCVKANVFSLPCLLPLPSAFMPLARLIKIAVIGRLDGLADW